MEPIGSPPEVDHVAQGPAEPVMSPEAAQTVDVSDQEIMGLRDQLGRNVRVSDILRSRGISPGTGTVRVNLGDGREILATTESENYGGFEGSPVPVVEIADADIRAMGESMGKNISVSDILRARGIRPDTGFVRVRVEGQPDIIVTTDQGSYGGFIRNADRE